MLKVLVTEKISEAGLDVLRQDPEVQLHVKTGLSREELLAEVGDVDGMITRSGTPLDPEILDAAKRLRAAARAGVGLDNIDLAEASRRGVVVINAPTGNTLAAAEHTMAMMLSLVRKVPQAFQSLASGEWKRSRFLGRQLSGKRLLIVGLGRIGTQVAARCRAFGMEVSAYDPYISPAKADRAGARLVEDLKGALSLADVITLHVPLTAETRGIIDGEAIKACRPGAYLVNCARGGLVDEAACAEALRSGHLAGAAIDVFDGEPPRPDNPLLAGDIRERVVLTPHIGANTEEAQSAVAVIACSNLLAALKGKPCENAVNLPFVEQSLPEGTRAFLSLARKLGYLAAHLSWEPATRLKVSLRGPLFSPADEPVCFEIPYHFSPFTVAGLKGYLEYSHGPEVNYMSAPMLAEDKGIRIEESRTGPGTWRNQVELELLSPGSREGISVSGTITEEGRQRVVNIGGYWIEFIPEGTVLLFSNHDRPGVIGKVGTLLGRAGTNIANFALGRRNGSGLAVGALQIDDDVPMPVLEELKKDVDLLWAVKVRFTEDL
ncbi:MAG TPA: phosphoglycerate dehydrogenase [Synergistales bacterium]|nr:phosphoglycerate dehydrogenase [Synergistales bacterium]HPC76019.1 phosphoglycerate dehydrogenase [Synergistales bacterium]HRS48842.1 phosphoglycerate dehydrogenase [Thermovirgaceae bacterium]HRU90886.1 phosphoglycerate dehydrogenase [Thermovirgaceae bacterium]